MLHNTLGKLGGVTLAAMLLATCHAGAQQLIQNGDFELNSGSRAPDWNVAYGDDHVWHIGGSFGNIMEIGPGSVGSQVNQQFVVGGSTSLEISLDYGVFSTGAASDPWPLEVVLLNSSDTAVWSQSLDAFDAAQTSSYSPIQTLDATTGILAPDTYTLQLTADNGWTTVDNVSVMAAPEPASLALAGLGGAAFLAFRRNRK